MVWMMNYQCLTHPTKEAHPSQRVHNGDRIIAVNGLDESIEMMMLGGGVRDSIFSYRFSQYPLGIKTWHIPKVVGKMIFLFQTVGYFSSIFPGFHHETAFLEIQPERCLRFDLHILMSLYVENIGWLSLYYLLTDNSSGKAGGVEKSQTLGIIDHSQVCPLHPAQIQTLCLEKLKTVQNMLETSQTLRIFHGTAGKLLKNATQQNCSLRDFFKTICDGRNRTHLPPLLVLVFFYQLVWSADCLRISEMKEKQLLYLHLGVNLLPNTSRYQKGSIEYLQYTFSII